MTTLTVSIGLKFEMHGPQGCKHGAALLIMPFGGLVSKVQTAVNLLTIGFKSLAFAMGV